MALLDRFKKKTDGTPDSSDTKKPVSETKAKTAKKKPAATEEKTEVVTSDAKKVSEKKSAPVVGGGRAYAVLMAPMVTEKATMTGTYYFRVHPSANKSEIKKAIFEVYKVKPKSVRVMNITGKKVRVGQRQQGQRSDWKKAIIRLEAGETMNVYEGT